MRLCKRVCKRKKEVTVSKNWNSVGHNIKEADKEKESTRK